MSAGQVLRHHWFDRLLHWLSAICILVLLGTSLPPQFGMDFNWVPLHWITGSALMLLSIVHIIRSLLWKPLLNMLPVPEDLNSKPGKYTLAQKLQHNAVAVAGLVAMVTGAMMTVRIDTPFWERDPYWLPADIWGLIYVLHGLMALLFISLIMLHVYFALRPEKRLYLRAMVRGYLTRAEFEREHDASRWPNQQQ